ncbi:MAG: transposase [Nitrosomonas sp.]|nr:transposase [Nitrosomonas sp.]
MLTTDFFIEAVQEAMNKYGKPEIFNTDQGCQFTSRKFIRLLKDNGIHISMDGKAAGVTTCLWSRLWKSVKYEEVYLHTYDSVSDAKRGLEKYSMFYNQNRPHTALDDKAPNECYCDSLPALQKNGIGINRKVST